MTLLGVGRTEIVSNPPRKERDQIVSLWSDFLATEEHAMFTKESINIVFSLRELSVQSAEKLRKIAESLRLSANLIYETIPASAEQTLALRSLQESLQYCRDAFIISERGETGTLVKSTPDKPRSTEGAPVSATPGTPVSPPEKPPEKKRRFWEK
jgi:hypothetical protein